MARYAHRALAASTPRGIITRVGATPDNADTYDDDHDIDWVAVERAANGDYEPALLNEAELRETAIALAKSGLRERAISTRICTYERRIGEWLAEAGLLPPERICRRDDCQRLMFGKGLCTTHLGELRREQKRARAAAQQTDTVAEPHRELAAA